MEMHKSLQTQKINPTHPVSRWTGCQKGRNMRKIKEHTCGTHIYMRLELSGKEYEVDCYIREGSETYRTTADGTEMREKVIAAFNELY